MAKRFDKDKLFSLKEAEATLPLVQRIVADISKITQEYAVQKECLNALKLKKKLTWEEKKDKLFPKEDKVKSLYQEIIKTEDELSALNIILLSLNSNGTVGFPTIVNNYIAYYIWNQAQEDSNRINSWMYYGERKIQKVPISWR